MNPTLLKQTYATVISDINNGFYALAMNALKPWLSELGEWTADEEWQQLHTLYQNMLHYTLMKVNDPQGDELMRQFTTRLYALTDHVWMKLMEQTSNDFVFAEKRVAVVSDVRWQLAVDVVSEFKTTNNEVAYAEAIDNMFDIVWLGDAITPTMEGDLKHFLLNNDSDKVVSVTLVSALTISLLYLYDATKMYWLLRAATSTHRQVRTRALIGVVLVLSWHDNRHDAVVLTQTVLKTSDVYETELLNICCALIQTGNTPRITQTIHQDVMPKLRDMASPLQKLKRNTDLTEINIDELQSALAENGLDSAIQQMTNMAMRGKDIYEETLSPLRRTPFFNRLSHWLIPFFPRHPQAKLLTAEHASLIADNNTLCDSDKYAITSMLGMMPTGNSAAIQAIKIDGEQMNELKQSAGDGASDTNRLFDLMNYVRDLYRLFALFNGAKNFRGVFGKVLKATATEWFSFYVHSSESQLQMANFLTQQKHYSEASVIYDRLLTNKQMKTDGEHFSRVGLCALKCNDVDKAIQYLQAALCLNENHLIAKRLLAEAYEKQGDIDKAIEMLLSLSQAQSDESILLKIARLYLKQNDYSHALNVAERVLYRNENAIEMLRIAAQCALEEGKIDVVMNYNSRIVNHAQHNVSDLISAGHLMMFLDSLSEAESFYNQAKIKQANNEKFVNLFFKDIDMLYRFGVSKEMIYSMLNKVMLE
ncbi:MAG: tetratricopeptide repeat protein [Bacteroidales bacterium]|nr:tetratricopeptide repeat protein [Bacteroidales bacterium]